MSKHKMLMIVDDDSDDRYLFCKALEQIDLSYHCHEAEHGRDALEQLRRATTLPHMIFLDLNMHLMNGWECLTALKRDPLLKNIPVIIYSTSSAEYDIAAAREMGAVYYLTKPSDMQEIVDGIDRAIKAAESASAR
jgi:CheY-like chemotaxis protein